MNLIALIKKNKKKFKCHQWLKIYSQSFLYYYCSGTNTSRGNRKPSVAISFYSAERVHLSLLSVR